MASLPSQIHLRQRLKQFYKPVRYLILSILIHRLSTSVQLVCKSTWNPTATNVRELVYRCVARAADEFRPSCRFTCMDRWRIWIRSSLLQTSMAWSSLRMPARHTVQTTFPQTKVRGKRPAQWEGPLPSASIQLRISARAAKPERLQRTTKL